MPGQGAVVNVAIMGKQVATAGDADLRVDAAAHVPKPPIDAGVCVLAGVLAVSKHRALSVFQARRIASGDATLLAHDPAGVFEDPAAQT